MFRKSVLKLAGTGAIVAAAFGIGVAVGQNAPTANKGVTVSPPTALDLTKEVDSVQGRQLRLRTVTIEPGGVVALHSHNGRPAVAMTLQGTLTEHVEGGETIERKVGESWSEDHTVSHWSENKGTTPVTIVAVDVFKP